jgi:hypothetical protein
MQIVFSHDTAHSDCQGHHHFGQSADHPDCQGRHYFGHSEDNSDYQGLLNIETYSLSLFCIRFAKEARPFAQETHSIWHLNLTFSYS